MLWSGFVRDSIAGQRIEAIHSQDSWEKIPFRVLFSSVSRTYDLEGKSLKLESQKANGILCTSGISNT